MTTTIHTILEEFRQRATSFSINRPQSITLKPQKILRPHQITALNKCAKMRLKPTVRYQIQ